MSFVSSDIIFISSTSQIYAAINGKSVDDPSLQAFFKFKCW